MTADEIPQRIPDLTPEWLTRALRERGHLGHGAVRDVQSQILGEGEGFMGVIARLTLDFEGDRGGAPERLIAKLPTLEDENRLMGELMGAYWREIHFYEELSHQVPARTPRVYYSALTPDPMRERQDRMVKQIDRLPGWILDPLLSFTRKMVGRKSHRYLLLLEDLAPARVGDQVVGGSPEECARVVRTLASMHAAFWEAPELDHHFWLAGQEVNPKIRHRMYLGVRDAFTERFDHVLSDDERAALDWLDRRGVELGRRLHDEAPATLLHCDMRFDNVFLEDSHEGPQPILADWQMTGRGAAAYDLAYFLTSTLPADAPESLVVELLETYHQALVEGGVAYAREDLERDYERSLMAVLQLLATTGAMELGAERGVSLIDAWVERTLARLRGVHLDALL